MNEKLLRLLLLADKARGSVKVYYTNNPPECVFGRVQVSVALPGVLSRTVGGKDLNDACEHWLTAWGKDADVVALQEAKDSA